jgi:predicted permease
LAERLTTAIVIAALLPVFLLIVLGLVLKRTLMRLETQWHGLERLTYYVLLPMLLIQTLVNANLTKVPVRRRRRSVVALGAADVTALSGDTAAARAA